MQVLGYDFPLPVYEDVKRELFDVIGLCHRAAPEFKIAYLRPGDAQAFNCFYPVFPAFVERYAHYFELPFPDLLFQPLIQAFQFRLFFNAGAHHVAQKSMSTSRPLSDERAKESFAAVRSLISGAISPVFNPCSCARVVATAEMKTRKESSLFNFLLLQDSPYPASPLLYSSEYRAISHS